MTVKPGVDWGELVPIPADAVDIGSDADLAAALERGERRALRLRGGDLFKAVGAPSGATSVKVPVDILRVHLDEHEATAVAHVIARPAGLLGWWRGSILCVMNVEHVGRADIAPRAHPNDGRFDVVEVAASMSWRDRRQAWRRLPTGTHVPHPDISTRRSRREDFSFDHPVAVRVDGIERGLVRSISISVVPDGATVFL